MSTRKVRQDTRRPDVGPPGLRDGGHTPQWLPERNRFIPDPPALPPRFRMPKEKFMQCRICGEGNQPGNLLLGPCCCRGTMGWMHQKCLGEACQSGEDNPARCDFCSQPWRGPAALEVAQQHFNTVDETPQLRGFRSGACSGLISMESHVLSSEALQSVYNVLALFLAPMSGVVESNPFDIEYDVSASRSAQNRSGHFEE